MARKIFIDCGINIILSRRPLLSESIIALYTKVEEWLRYTKILIYYKLYKEGVKYFESRNQKQQAQLRLTPIYIIILSIM